MKYKNIFKSSMLAIFLLCGTMFFTTCSDNNVKIGSIDEGTYLTTTDVLGYIVNAEGKKTMATVEFREEGTTELFLGLSKNAAKDVSAEFKYTPAVLDAYNQANGTNYELYPEAKVTFANNGAVAISAGSTKSTAAKLIFTSDESLKLGVGYVIPVTVKANTNDVQLSDSESKYLIFVRDNTKIPTANKASGIKIISCMEINDTNPLNNLCFTLKGSGKPLIDIVILFSANINYNNETGRVFVSKNPNVEHLLANKDKYLKPLQDRGMKVVLGILGNHDRSGVANLADETAREFAKELKAVCDAYNLDGIFYDDEYSGYQRPAPIGFVNPSNNAAARLCYETKKLMPDRLVCAYVYGRTSSFPNPVDGAKAGEYVDYGIHDYGGSWDLSSNYPGMPKSGMSLYSQEFNLNRGIASEQSLKRLRDEGYGANMIFAMDPNRANFLYTQKPAMARLAKVLFDDELVYDEAPQPKDW